MFFKGKPLEHATAFLLFSPAPARFPALEFLYFLHGGHVCIISKIWPELKVFESCSHGIGNNLSPKAKSPSFLRSYLC